MFIEPIEPIGNVDVVVDSPALLYAFVAIFGVLIPLIAVTGLLLLIMYWWGRKKGILAEGEFPRILRGSFPDEPPQSSTGAPRVFILFQQRNQQRRSSEMETTQLSAHEESQWQEITQYLRDEEYR